MPFKRKFRKSKNVSIAKKALRKVNKLERKVRPEVKIFDVDVNSIVPTIAGLLVHINPIPQGDGVETRDGLHAQCIGFKLNYQLLITANNSCRVMIVRDNRQVESTDPAVLDVILTAAPLAQKSRVNPKRFTVYYDMVHAMDPDDTNRLVRRKFHKKQFPMQWIGALGTTQTRNGLYLITNSDVADSATLTFSFRMWFTDM